MAAPSDRIFGTRPVIPVQSNNSTLEKDDPDKVSKIIETLNKLMQEATEHFKRGFQTNTTTTTTPYSLVLKSDTNASSKNKNEIDLIGESIINLTMNCSGLTSLYLARKGGSVGYQDTSNGSAPVDINIFLYLGLGRDLKYPMQFLFFFISEIFPNIIEDLKKQYLPETTNAVSTSADDAYLLPNSNKPLELDMIDNLFNLLNRFESGFMNPTEIKNKKWSSFETYFTDCAAIPSKILVMMNKMKSLAEQSAKQTRPMIFSAGTTTSSTQSVTTSTTFSGSLSLTPTTSPSETKKDKP